MKDALNKALTIIINVGDTDAMEYLVSIQDQILEFIIYCSGFIQEYIHHSLIGKNSVESLFNNYSLYIITLVGQAYRKDKKDTIEGLKGKLGELRKELGEALLIQIDKKVDGIDGKVDGIDGKVDGIDGKLDDVLERIPKKRILEGMYNDTTSSFISINLLNRVGEQTKADAGDWLRSE